jgi:hypothetical protein
VVQCDRVVFGLLGSGSQDGLSSRRSSVSMGLSCCPTHLTAGRLLWLDIRLLRPGMCT